ncbi:fatty-acid-CoA ligase [Achlya hypogyna]|uniref:Fatty-acid-CoA ligase n=1 Tax=Achlya hypogyna TaxID=1202772 RepID=A0A1V9Z1E6_ACHHY|nr:fatty-acid-CoA ligase [Achlya hypogyna]
MTDTLLARLDRWASAQPDKTIYAFADDNGIVTATLTYKEFDDRTLNLARWMLASPSSNAKGMGLQRDEKVLLVYPPGLDFIVAFVACLRAGVVAVPVYPPDPRKLRKDIVQFTTVCSNAGAKTALTCASYNHVKKVLDIKQKMTFSEKYPWPELSWVETDRLVHTAAPDAGPLPAPSADAIAFLQYTSGSTSDPKGVMISHGNLSHNLNLIADALAAREDAVVVSWLPQYHDMGLIGAYLGVLFTGGNGVYMSPFSFIKNPSIWIELIGKHKATHLQAPNFAYALVARKFKGLAGLDLSSVRHMINGAEPIDAGAIDAFYAALAPYGLRAGVVRPTYGLAEHTVYVCDSSPQLTRLRVVKSVLETEDKLVLANEATPAQDVKEMVGCGQPVVDVRVVNADTRREQPAGTVGEIWIRSGSTTQGYFGQAALTDEMFRASLVEAPDTHYMRTGDLGVLYQKQLFICGRLKDLIIVRGRNHYPQDVEKTIEGFEEIRPGCSAAFAAAVGDGEVLCMMAEVRPETTQPLAELAAAIRMAVAAEHGVQLAGVVFVETRSIPKTTSGKISRRRCKVAFLSQTLREIHRSVATDDGSDGDAPPAPAKREFPPFATVPARDVQAFLCAEIAQLANVPKTSVTSATTLHELGMDSMNLTQLQGIIANQYGLHAPEEVLYGESTTVEGLYEALKAAPPSTPHMAPNVGGDNQTSFLESPPTPKQSRMCCGCIAIR